MFKLDARLENDTIELGKIEFIKVLMSKDNNYPWLILVPEIADATELFDLNTQQQQLLMQTITKISKDMQVEFSADKINVGALGNVVKQLHIHIVARFETDIAWPGPIWGQHPAKPYTQEQLEAQINKMKEMLGL
ncbi:MAG: hypothetical protein CFH44_01097 [Proteobacteria bacterium]|nr:MAG: hypothetical protein CFH44_01097 [Pseudomonadota bacterium]|tara:strand:- start:75 stop:479 length:405 start_codon:yes stop_codon:yes gene_type:complete